MPMFTLSETAFEGLLKQLVDLEEGKNDMIEAMFRGSSKERDQFVDLIDEYVSQLDRLIRNAGRSNKAGSGIPFVTINSEVEAVDMKTGETFQFCVINPFDSGSGGNEISFMSPVGRAMLMKEPGDEVNVNAPGGVFQYRITAVRLMDRPYRMALSR